MTTFWQLPPESLRADPPVVETTALASMVLRLDTRRYMAAGARLPPVPAPRTTLHDITAGRDVPLPSPRMAGAIITQVVERLERGHDYQLSWSWTVGPGDRPSRIQIIRCVG